jgi:mono/diheme cytochrome c family protein
MGEGETMARYRIEFAGLIVILALAVPAAAQPVVTDQQGNVERGRELAQAWCAECHAIGPKVTEGKRPGPNFVDFANRASTTPLSLNVFLRSNHETMPNLIVARGEGDDLVAYILRLKGR